MRLFESGEKAQVIAALEALGAAIDLAATSDPHDLPNRVYFMATPETILAAARMREVFWVEDPAGNVLALVTRKA